jgi:hypothetical protein
VAVDVPPPFDFFELVQMHFLITFGVPIAGMRFALAEPDFYSLHCLAVKGDLRRPSYGPSWQMQPVDDVAKGARF